jgi:hypothetical protein
VLSDRSNRFAALAAVMYRILSKGSFGISAVKAATERIPIDPGHRGYSPTPPRLWPLIRCFRIADGVNTITRREEFATSEPVFGLRPIRRPFLSFLVIALFPAVSESPITEKCASRHRYASLVLASVCKKLMFGSV